MTQGNTGSDEYIYYLDHGDGFMSVGICPNSSNCIQADLEDIAGSVPGHCNKVNTTIMWVTRIFWFPSAYKSDVDTIL